MLERGIKQLITQALDSKAKVFQTRIEGVVQNYIYTQQHPQNQEKQRQKEKQKHKTVDEKEDTKPSSDTKHAVISDISELIPIPGPPSTVTKATETADKKSGAQEGAKNGTSKGFPTAKKSHSTQGKSNLHTGKGEEGKTGSPLYEKAQADDSSRTKDGKSRTSRVKTESLSRDESRLSPKVEESIHKVKDDKCKITRVKAEVSSPGESCASSLVEARFSDKNIASGGRSEVGNQSHLFSVAVETDASQDDVTKATALKTEQGNEASTEGNVKVKEEKNATSGMSEQNNFPRKMKEETDAEPETKVIDDCGKLKQYNILLNEESESNMGAQSDSFQTANLVDEIPQVWSRINENPAIDVTVSSGEIKMDESIETSETVKGLSEKVYGELEAASEEETSSVKGVEHIVSTVKMTSSDLSGMKSTQLSAVQGGIDKAVKELPSGTRSGAAELEAINNEIQRQKLPDESQELLSQQKEDDTGSDSNLVAASDTKEDFGQPSSIGEYSDGESDISDVSSVHTSDLSSFDEQISSLSESYDDEEETHKGETSGKSEHEADGDTERASMSQNERDSDAQPRRRSTRISSRRSTKEGESEISESETSRQDSRGSSHKRRHGEKRTRKPRSETSKVRSISDVDKPRRRGRPRKDERRMSSHSGSQIRRSRIRHREDSSTTADRSESDSKESRSTRSQRQIKRTRCYSPSREGTREVFLPRKRSREDPN